MGYHMKWRTPKGDALIRIGSFGLADEMDEVFDVMKLPIKFNFENSYCNAEITPEAISAINEAGWGLLKSRLPEVFIAFRSAHLISQRDVPTSVIIT